MSKSAASRLSALRYAVLDECFVRNPDRAPGEPLPRVFKKDLLDLVNKRLKEAMPGVKPIAMRTLEKDIQDMQRIFGVKIVRYHEKKRAFYAYAEEGMSIRAGGLTAAEQAKLTSAVDICSRFAGDGSRSWLPWALGLIRHTFHLDESSGKSRRQQRESQGWSVSAVGRFPDEGELSRILNTLPVGQPVALKLRNHDVLSFRPDHLHSGLQADFVCGMERRSGLDAGEDQWVFRVLDWRDIASAEPITDPMGAPEVDWAAWCKGRLAIETGVWEDVSRWELPVEEVRIWFAEDRAKSLHSRSWHSSQHAKTEKAAGGEIFTFNLVADQALMRAVLAEGPQAQLLEPLTLRDEMRDVLNGGWARMYDAMFGP